MSWPVAFLLTLLLELPVVLWLTPTAHRRRLLPWILLANGTSHPTLWFVLFPLLLPRYDYSTVLVLAEALVFAYEGILYAVALRDVRGVGLSVVANGFSLGVGQVIHALL